MIGQEPINDNIGENIYHIFDWIETTKQYIHKKKVVTKISCNLINNNPQNCIIGLKAKKCQEHKYIELYLSKVRTFYPCLKQGFFNETCATGLSRHIHD